MSGISGEMDNFTDFGLDLSYARTFNNGSFTLHSSLIKENESRNATVNNYNFSSYKIDGNLYLKNGLGATIGYFNSSGTADASVESLTSKPNSNGLIYQIEYLPWYNTKFSIQYVT